MATQVYDVKTVEVASQIQNTLLVAEQPGNLYAHVFALPSVTVAEAPSLVNSQID